VCNWRSENYRVSEPRMGLLSTVMGVVGFGWGISLGLVVGYFVFIYLQSTDVKDPITKPVAELDTKTLLDLLPEIPLWVKNPDYDRVDWLNKFLKDLWPYLDKAICKIISETAQPYIRDYGPKFKLDSIEFESLTLGTLSPTLVGKMQISFPQRRCLEDVLSCTLCLTVVQQIQGCL
jgi:hypothetical protein